MFWLGSQLSLVKAGHWSVVVALQRFTLESPLLCPPLTKVHITASVLGSCIPWLTITAILMSMPTYAFGLVSFALMRLPGLHSFARSGVCMHYDLSHPLSYCLYLARMSRHTFCRAEPMRTTPCSASEAVRIIQACQHGDLNLASDISANLAKIGAALEDLQVQASFASVAAPAAGRTGTASKTQQGTTSKAAEGPSGSSKKEKKRKDDATGEKAKKKKQKHESS